MPQRIDVPGMGIVEFPDGMNDAQIVAAIKANMPQDQGPSEGAGSAALIAAGRGTDKLIQGVRQLYNSAIGDNATLSKMAAAEADKDRLYTPLRQAHPFATAIGETAPSMAAGVMTGGTSMLAGATAAGLPSLLAYGTPEERIKRAGVDALGGAAGVKAGQLLARVIQPAGAGAANVADDAMKAAERVGYKPTAGQITNNPAMQSFENYLLRTPGGSGTMQRALEANQTALNRAGAKAMGESADNLGEGVFASAKARIGAEFDRLGTVTKPDLQGGFLNALAKVDADNAARGSFASKEVNSLVDKALDLAAKNNLDGKAYKEIRSELASRAQAAFKAGDSTTGQAYKTVYGALDDAAKASLSKADQEAWDVARQQWKAFKTLAKSNVAEGGNVSAARAASAVRAQGPQLRTGQASGELADIARIGEAFKGVPNPTSGQLVNQMLFSNPITGLPMLAANKAAAAAYMSPLGTRYFSQGLLNLSPAQAEQLGLLGMQAGVPATRSWLGAE